MSIDYGMGQTNIDRATGFRFGVISQHDIMQAWSDSSEPADDANCPQCGNDVEEVSDTVPPASVREDIQHYSTGCDDYYCKHCDHFIDSADCFPDEPSQWRYEGDGYVMVSCQDNTEVMVCKSPFFTYAHFCSPCFPGAGNLNQTDGCYEEVEPDLFQAYGVESYCVGHDWFEEGKAPYPVFGVVSGRPCYPDAWYGHNLDYRHTVGWRQADGSVEYTSAWCRYRGPAADIDTLASNYCAEIIPVPFGWGYAG